MEYRTLGSTGLQISAIGFGTGGTSGLMGRGEPEEQRKVTHYALDKGINYFDTAPGYDATKSESSLGRTLQELGARPLVGTKARFGRRNGTTSQGRFPARSTTASSGCGSTPLT